MPQLAVELFIGDVHISQTVFLHQPLIPVFPVGLSFQPVSTQLNYRLCDLLRVHRRVTRIDHLYDVAAVCYPAYDNTVLYARSKADAEALVREAMEVAKRQRMDRLREIGAAYLKGEDPTTTKKE